MEGHAPLGTALTLCASCGLENDDGLCLHHHYVSDDDWHVGNRIYCDFFHRKKEPVRLPERERRDESFWGSSDGAIY